MKNIIIAGAGGCGREVLQWVKDINKASIIRKWNIKGFIDDNPNAINDKMCEIQIIGSIDSYEIQEEDEFICAVGNPLLKESIVEKLINKGAQFTNVIHPTAIVADNARLGAGTILYPFSIISDNANLGDYCVINMYSAVAHDSILGKYCTISAFCDITGNSQVGNHVFMGTSVKLVPGLKIGNKSFICAGSVVMTRVKEGTKVMGNPAKKVGL